MAFSVNLKKIPFSYTNFHSLGSLLSGLPLTNPGCPTITGIARGHKRPCPLLPRWLEQMNFKRGERIGVCHFTYLPPNNGICARKFHFHTQFSKNLLIVPWEGEPCGAVKCAKTHKCANFQICANISPTKCANNHICANIFAHKCANLLIKKNINHKMCKHHAYKCANVQFWREMCKQHPTNVQIIVFKNQFTSAKLSTDDILVLSQHLYTQVRSLGAIFSEGP